MTASSIARRLIRWLSAASVLGALWGFWRFTGGDSSDGMWTIVWFGVVGGAIGGLRMTTARFGGLADPRSYDAGRDIWHAYGRSFVNFMWAGGIWLVGGIVVTVVSFALQGGPRSPSDMFAVLFLGLIWAIAYGIAWIAVLLVWLPVSCVVEARRARLAGEKVNPWWWPMAAVIGGLDLAVLSLILLFVLIPAGAVPDGADPIVGVLVSVPAASLPWWTVIVLWVARVSWVLVIGFLVVGGTLVLFGMVPVPGAAGARRRRTSRRKGNASRRAAGLDRRRDAGTPAP